MFRSETFPIVSSRSDVSSPSCSVEFDKISITKCHITFHDVIPQEFSTVPIFKLMKENIHKNDNICVKALHFKYFNKLIFQIYNWRGTSF